eukprot:TRINITY_DN50131_c0_g1_i1.p1 TRINITY_DN50131_c0_g1~~TRINITY_DN50131_c0_g1_i1.p1  ORF type:complete len:227 (-),score=12.91 TRINITY_DN50131_c0_g1_i1:119-799(-)
MSNQLNLNNLANYPNTPKYSFTGRPEVKDKRAGLPGPGHYPPLATEKDKFANNPKWSIGAGVRDDGRVWAKYPGPGEYKQPMNTRYRQSPQWRFGSEPRLHEAKPQPTPGPGKYEVRGNLEGQQSSISGRPEGSSKRSQTPGPGAYKAEGAWMVTAASAPKISFGGSSRSDIVGSKTPGPGKYESMSTLGGNAVMKTSGKFSFTCRHPAPASDVTPGPVAASTTFK